MGIENENSWISRHVEKATEKAKKEKLIITDEEVSVVRKLFNQGFRPFHDGNDHLFKDPEDPKRDIPNAFQKLRNATVYVAKWEKENVSQALTDYMWLIRSQSDEHLLSLAVISLSEIVGQKRKVVNELLSYHRLHQMLEKANLLFATISHEKD